MGELVEMEGTTGACGPHAGEPRMGERELDVGVVSLVCKADNPAWRPSMHVRRKENKGQRPVGQCIGLACWNAVVGLPWLGRQPAKWPNWAPKKKLGPWTQMGLEPNTKKDEIK